MNLRFNDAYSKLNSVLNEYFFNGRLNGIPVYLDFEEDVSSLLSEKLSINIDDVEQEVGKIVGLTINLDEENIYKDHLGELKAWQARDVIGDPPPFTALLMCFSLAAERMHGDGNFSSQNYYVRLVEIFSGRAIEKLEAFRSSAKYTEKFWLALNNWLIDSDYIYGIPTAKPSFSSKKYVGYSISQSVVRDAERDHFKKMFSHYGLSANGNYSDQELSIYLNEWALTEYSTKSLRNLMADPDVRERVLDAAIEELSKWGGDLSSVKNNQVNRLSWLAVVKNFPVKRRVFYLVQQAYSPSKIGRVKLSENSNSVAKLAIINESGVCFNSLSGSNLSYLGPLENLNIEALLQASLSLESEEQDVFFSRNPKHIIVFQKQEGQAVYTEVSRASLMHHHACLVHKSWIGKVRSYLGDNAANNFEISEEGEQGIPSGWFWIDKVRILNIPDIDDQSLMSLVPIVAPESLEQMGGVKLLHRMWHLKAPPEILATKEGEIQSVKLKKRIGVGYTDVHFEDAMTYDPGFLSKLELDDGVYQIQYGDAKKREQTILFRSADTPRPQSLSNKKKLAYLLNSNGRLRLNSADSINNESDEPSLVGMKLSGSVEVPNVFWDFNSQLEKVDLEDSWESYGSKDIELANESCILRGYHHFLCPPQEKGVETSRIIKCQDCGLIEIVPKKQKKKKNKKIKHSRQVSNNLSADLQNKALESFVGTDVLYDSLCYMGSGSWSVFQRIVSPHLDYPWQITNLGANLIDLGFIDVSLVNHKSRPENWSCSPPVLMRSFDGQSVFLSGFRNDRLMNELHAQMGEPLTNESQDALKLRPVYVGWNICDDSFQEISSKLKDVRSSLGENLHISENISLKILSGLPSISEIQDSLMEITVSPDEDVEVFDVESNKWIKGTVTKLQAHRIKHAGLRYFYVNESGVSLQGSNEVIKLLSARSSKKYLHSYTKDQLELRAQLGCQLPGLYRRAYSAISGMLPEKKDGLLIYRDVPEDFASILFNKLYG